MVIYRGLYKGIDLRYYFTPDGLKYEFVCQAFSDPNVISMHYEGSDYLELDDDGNLLIKAEEDFIIEEKPYIYQESGDINGGFSISSKDKVSYTIEEYDNSELLIIDPSLYYSTFIGGSGNEMGYKIAVDSDGNAYITGYTFSTDFPTTPGCYNDSHNSSAEVFVTKLNSNGSKLIYSTYIGGENRSYGRGITVDSSGNAYIIGNAESGYPTTKGAYDTSNNGLYDVIVTKLNSEGSNLTYSTYIGCGGQDLGRAITVDSKGNAYITGRAGQNSNPPYPTTKDAYDTSHNGQYDVFVTKLNDDGSNITYSTYIGGSHVDDGFDIALDSDGIVYITGDTYNGTVDFPTTSGAYDETHNGGDSSPDDIYDVFIAKLNMSSKGEDDLEYSTFIGGGSNDRGRGITLDSEGYVYVSGWTTSNLTKQLNTTEGAYDIFHNGGDDAFILKLNMSGKGEDDLIYSTFVGGVQADGVQTIALDSNNNAYIVGGTDSDNFPTTPYCYDDSHNGKYDIYLFKLNSDGSNVLYSSYIGGGDNDQASGGLALDSNGNVYVTGFSVYNDTELFYPTTSGVVNETHNGGNDVIVSKFIFANIPDHDYSGWKNLGAQQNDADTNSTDINNTINNKLQFYMDDYYIYYQLSLEDTPDIDNFTYSVLMDDGGDGTYDFCISTYNKTDSVKIYKWDSTNKWDNDNNLTKDIHDFNIDLTNNVIQFAVAFIDTFKPDSNDLIYAATYDEEAVAFEEEKDWESKNDPKPDDATEGDHTEPSSIPEFTNAFVPGMVVIALFVVLRKKKRRKK